MKKQIMTEELKRMYKLAGLINENADNSNGVHINGKKVNINSIEIDGVDRRDSPDFVDAYISYAEYEDGTELSDAELNELGEDGELVNELIFDRQLYLEENSKLNEAIEDGLTFDELPDKIRDYFRRITRSHERTRCRIL
jgi:hypothetical protein